MKVEAENKTRDETPLPLDPGFLASVDRDAHSDEILNPDETDDSDESTTSCLGTEIESLDLASMLNLHEDQDSQDTQKSGPKIHISMSDTASVKSAETRVETPHVMSRMKSKLTRVLKDSDIQTSETTRDVQEDPFSELLDWHKYANREMYVHINNVVHCVRRHMWYNPDTLTLVTDLEFQQMKSTGKIYQYSTNPRHPVFGFVKTYETYLAPQMLEFVSELKMIVSTLLEVEREHRRWVDVLAFLGAPAILTISHISDSFRRQIMSDMSLWRDIWRDTYPDIQVPEVSDLSRLWLYLNMPRNDKVHEVYTTSSMSKQSIRGLIIRYAADFRLVHGDQVQTIHTDTDQLRDWTILEDVQGMKAVETEDLTEQQIAWIDQMK